MLDLRIQQHFIDSADLQYQAAEPLAKPVEAGVQALLACVTSGGKVLVAGWGGTAAAAPYFASLFVGGFERERPELAALALTADSPDDQCLARQVRALGHMGDVLMVLTATGDEAALLQAVRAATGVWHSLAPVVNRHTLSACRALPARSLAPRVPPNTVAV